ncbi:MAG TPA: hypothetical protein VGN37_15700 [Actinocatenispora sp.]
MSAAAATVRVGRTSPTVTLSLVAARVGSTATAARVTSGDLSGHAGYLAAQYTAAWHVVLWAVAAVCAASAVLIGVPLRPRR